MQKPMHLYIVFNPMLNNEESVYSSQAHEFYFQLKNKISSGEPEKSFMYWGKLSVNEKVDDDLLKYKSIIAENSARGEDTHLYITDYHHFWVAKIESVHNEVFSKEHTLAFYDDKKVDLWFKVSDMDLLSAEFEETSYYLRQLFVDNQFESSKIDQIHQYIGGVKFPLIVQDNSEERYFKNIFSGDGVRVRRDNALISNPKALGDVKHQVNSFVLPPQVFSKLSNIVRSEILNVETILSKREGGNPTLNKEILVSYLKILENVMSDTLSVVLKNELGDCLYISNDGKKFFDHKTENNMSIRDFKETISMGAFISLLSDVNTFGNLSLTQLEKNYPELIYYFVNTIHPMIEKYELVQKRENIKDINAESISKKDAFVIRNAILGVGSSGFINNLVKLSDPLSINNYLLKAS